MPVMLDNLQQLIRDYEEARRGEAEQSGRLKEALRRLRDELGVDSERGAARLVRRLQRKRDRMAAAYLAALKQFESDFRNYLDSLKEDGDE